MSAVIRIRDTGLAQQLNEHVKNSAVVERSRFVHHDMLVVGYREKLPNTLWDSTLEAYVPTKGVRGQKLREDLQQANAARMAARIVQKEFHKHVASIAFDYTDRDYAMFDRAFVMLENGDVVVYLPDIVVHKIVFTDAYDGELCSEAEVRAILNNQHSFPISVDVSLTKRLVNICAAAELSVSPLVARALLRRAYLQLPPMHQHDVVPYGFALVILLEQISFEKNLKTR